jgi:hypothetical protein
MSMAETHNSKEHAGSRERMTHFTGTDKGVDKLYQGVRRLGNDQ